MIDKCSHGGWYKDLVGQKYPVYADEGIEWRTHELEGPVNFILKEDATYVVDAETTKEQ